MLTRDRVSASTEPRNGDESKRESSHSSSRKSVLSTQPNYYRSSQYRVNVSPPEHYSPPTPLIYSVNNNITHNDTHDSYRFHRTTSTNYPPQPQPPILPVYPHPPPPLPRDPTFPEIEPHKPYPPSAPLKGSITIHCQYCLPRDSCIKLAYCSIFSSLIGVVLIFTILFSGILQPIQGNKKMAPSQTIKIDSLDTNFCQGVEVTGDVATVSLFNEEPPINVSINNKFIRLNDIPAEDHIIWSWDLNPGSVVNISMCGDDDEEAISNVIVIVFEGDYNYNSWLNAPNSDETNAIYESSIQSDCKDHSYDDYYLQVSTSNTYYFVFSNPATETTSITTQFDMTRMEYDTSKALKSCSSQCSVSFDYNSNEFIIVTSLDSGDPDDVLQINWKCKPLLIYFILFLGLAFMCCFLPLWIYLFCYWPTACLNYCKERWNYRSDLANLQNVYIEEVRAHEEAEKTYEILKPSYESARAQWYASQYVKEKENIYREYTEACKRYDQDKALWTRTVFAAEKERLIKEYELSLKIWTELYGTSNKPSSQPTQHSSSTLTTPLLGGRSISVPVAFTINERTENNFEEMS